MKPFLYSTNSATKAFLLECCKLCGEEESTTIAATVAVYNRKPALRAWRRSVNLGSTIFAVFGHVWTKPLFSIRKSSFCI